LVIYNNFYGDFEKNQESFLFIFVYMFKKSLSLGAEDIYFKQQIAPCRTITSAWRKHIFPATAY